MASVIFGLSLASSWVSHTQGLKPDLTTVQDAKAEALAYLEATRSGHRSDAQRVTEVGEAGALVHALWTLVRLFSVLDAGLEQVERREADGREEQGKLDEEEKPPAQVSLGCEPNGCGSSSRRGKGGDGGQ